MINRLIRPLLGALIIAFSFTFYLVNEDEILATEIDSEGLKVNFKALGERSNVLYPLWIKVGSPYKIYLTIEYKFVEEPICIGEVIIERQDGNRHRYLQSLPICGSNVKVERVNNFYFYRIDKLPIEEGSRLIFRPSKGGGKLDIQFHKQSKWEIRNRIVDMILSA